MGWWSQAFPCEWVAQPPNHSIADESYPHSYPYHILFCRSYINVNHSNHGSTWFQVYASLIIFICGCVPSHCRAKLWYYGNYYGIPFFWANPSPNPGTTERSPQFPVPDGEAKTCLLGTAMLATFAVLSRDVGAARRLSDAQTAAPAPVRAAANLNAGNSPAPLRLGNMVDGWVVMLAAQ